MHELQRSANEESDGGEKIKRYELLILSSDLARVVGGGLYTQASFFSIVCIGREALSVLLEIVIFFVI